MFEAWRALQANFKLLVPFSAISCQHQMTEQSLSIILQKCRVGPGLLGLKIQLLPDTIPFHPRLCQTFAGSTRFAYDKPYHPPSNPA